MGNVFKAHIFKQRQRGEREEVKLTLFNLDGSPMELGNVPMLTGLWDYDLALTAPPDSGELRSSPDPIESLANVYLSGRDSNGFSWMYMMNQTPPVLSIGYSVHLRGSNGSSARFEITGLEIVGSDPDGYASIEAIFSEIIGEVSKNTQIEVTVFRP